MILRSGSSSAVSTPESNPQIGDPDVMAKQNESLILNISPSPFSRNDPASWFRQLEALFEINKVTDDNLKYIYVQARIEPAILSVVSDFFCAPPETEKYPALKKRIVAEFSDSPRRNVQKLLQDLTLGDRRPTQLLREMRTLADGNVTDDFLRPLFLARLPEQVQFVLAASEESLDKLAEMADRMLDFNVHRTEVSNVNAINTRKSSLPTDTVQQYLTILTEQVTKLTSTVSDLVIRVEKGCENCSQSTSGFNRSRSRSRGPTDRDRSSSRNRSQIPEGVSLCYYHYTFGKNARKCKRLENGSACSMQLPSEN